MRAELGILGSSALGPVTVTALGSPKTDQKRLAGSPRGMATVSNLNKGHNKDAEGSAAAKKRQSKAWPRIAAPNWEMLPRLGKDEGSLERDEE